MTREFAGKRLLLLGGIQMACPIVKKAQELGAYVIVADYNLDSPAKMISDEALLLDATDIKAIIDWCKANPVDGVTTGFVDILMPVCYEVCKALGLPYYATPKMISMATNKQDFKETCDQFGVPVPQTYLIGGHIVPEIYESLQYPVFVKPLDASGSRGAGVCYNEVDLNAQFAQAVSYSPTGNAIIEDYIQGREFLLDYVGVGGEFRLLSMFDRYLSDDRGSAVNYSNVSICPSKAIDTYYEKINQKVLDMFRSLGFTDGLIFLQGHSNGDRITFYEMGCRLGGSFFVLDEAVLGLNPVEMIVRYALTGKMLHSIEQIDSHSAAFPRIAMVSNYLLQGADEVIFSIDGIEAVKSLESFVGYIQEREVGCHFQKDSTIDKNLVSFYCVADDMEQLKNDLRFMNEVMQVRNAEGKSLLTQKLNPDTL